MLIPHIFSDWGKIHTENYCFIRGCRVISHMEITWLGWGSKISEWGSFYYKVIVVKKKKGQGNTSLVVDGDWDSDRSITFPAS